MREVHVYLVWDNNADSWVTGRVFKGVFGSFKTAEDQIPMVLLSWKHDVGADQVKYGPYYTIERRMIRAEVVE